MATLRLSNGPPCSPGSKRWLQRSTEQGCIVGVVSTPARELPNELRWRAPFLFGYRAEKSRLLRCVVYAIRFCSRHLRGARSFRRRRAKRLEMSCCGARESSSKACVWRTADFPGISNSPHTRAGGHPRRVRLALDLRRRRAFLGKRSAADGRAVARGPMVGTAAYR